MKLTRVTSENVEEWAALYVDGVLDRVGDSYLIDERIRDLAQVEEKDGNFLLGGNYRDDAAKTLEEIDQYEANREQLLAKAAEMEAAAKALEAQAAALRASQN